MRVLFKGIIFFLKEFLGILLLERVRDSSSYANFLMQIIDYGFGAFRITLSDCFPLDPQTMLSLSYVLV